jgi:hypothetical protein
MKFCCGISSHDVDEEAAVREREVSISSLKQSRSVRTFLHIMLVFNLLFGTFMFIFWSLWKYEAPPLDSVAVNMTTGL